MKIKLIFIVFTFLIPAFLSAQKNPKDQINQYNSNGEKEGYWVEDRGFDIIETYYRNGRMSGVFKSYTTTEPKTLRYFGEFEDGEVVGKWYHFDSNGQIWIQQMDFGVNTDTVILYDNVKFVYPHKCRTKIYYPNGLIKSEGILLWDEDPELDDVREYGEWKYYDEEGNLIETKNFH